MINSNRLLVLWAVIVLLMSCSKAPKIDSLVDPSIIQFSGEKALQSLTEFVTQFPNRDSSQPNNKNAAEWLDEEYGMLGTLRFVQTHPNIGNIIVGLSLDNVGKEFYNGLRMDPRGQFRGCGALWFRLLAQEAALSFDDDWVPIFNPVIIQILDQAVPISFMDEGPLVADGMIGINIGVLVPREPTASEVGMNLNTATGILPAKSEWIFGLT